ncbi:unnamed protein product [Didymodactylos carnosus]|uniref:NAD(P)(+)--arginine ADP-ribosyltransferase n=1 Tax=Didymodactylos carnosus TaxID=1234261 RepID=A0A814JBG4_9BILA|nr:unnamed protein product [Didymodactylos carnosus]CAF1034520.1 unnamed protein product [Didymodactylos carnosus]CAF3621478.1 unnamed protein product [Didymodactylos carnosus]CAF3805196.1 unnamed protein product [Didymodactylos carnosus]
MNTPVLSFSPNIKESSQDILESEIAIRSSRRPVDTVLETVLNNNSNSNQSDGNVLFQQLEHAPSHIGNMDQAQTVIEMASNPDNSSVTYTHDRYSDVGNESGRMLTPIQGYAQLPLVSLEEAVKPIETVIPDIQRQVYIAKERCKQPCPDGLTHDESAAILLYTMEWQPKEQSVYFVLNSILRLENRENIKPFYLYLKLVFTALWKLPSRRQTVYRGIDKDLNKEYELNKTYTWWGFSSTTETPAQTQMFLGKSGKTRTLFNIDCLHGKMIIDHSFFRNEKEILLLPAVQFEVVSKLNPSPDIYIIHLKEVIPKFELLQAPSPSFEKLSTHQPIPSANHVSTAPPYLTPVASTKGSSFGGSNSRAERLNDEVRRNREEQRADFQRSELTDNELQMAVLNEIKTNRNWTELRLSQNKITPRGLKELCQTLKTNTIITKILIWDNPLTDEGAKLFADLLMVNRTLISISLDGTQMTDAGISELATMLRSNNTLQELHVGDNEITDKGIITLAQSLKSNIGLQWLSIKNNKISDKSVPALVEMLKENETLSTLNLDHNYISDKGKFKLQQAITTNRVVKSLLIDNQSTRCKVQ